METWKEIKGYCNYQCSSLGRIKTFNWKNKGIEKIMKPAFDNGGYLRTMLKREDGKFCTIKVHRIVAQSFLENEENKETVNHINGIKHDNRVENLEWATRSENSKHAVKMGLITDRKGEKNPASTLTNDQVLEIRKLKGKYKKIDIAKKFNTSFHIVKRILSNKTWKHL